MRKVRLFIAALLMVSTCLHAKDYQHELGSVELTQVPEKVVVLDWVLAETLLTLGVTPYAIADEKGYRDWVSQPYLPEEVKDVGSRREPNLELLAQLEPDLIVISQQLSPVFDKLSEIAPTMVLTTYSSKKEPYRAAERVTRQLGEVLGRQVQAKQVIVDTRAALRDNGLRIEKAGLASRPLLLVRFIGDKHLRIHGEGSLAQNTLELMGLTSGWQGDTNQWGFASAGMEKLAPRQQANVLYFGPLEEKEQQKIFTTPLWRAMAFTREDRVYELPAIWTFGGLKSAQRMSDHITRLLTTGQKG